VNGVFEFIVILATLALLAYFKFKSHRYWKRYYLILISVVLFEFSTHFAWTTSALDPFTFIGPSLNWVIFLAWTLIIFFMLQLGDFLYPEKKSEGRNFTITLICMSVLGILFEQLLLSLQIRGYGAEVNALLIGHNIPFLTVPLEALYYIPVFMALILGFVRYFEELHARKPRPYVRGGKR
jgi:hypothetical protein